MTQGKKNDNNVRVVNDINTVSPHDTCMGAGAWVGLSKIRAVAWVIVVADGACHLVDGLTAAASFSISISKVSHLL